MREEKNVGRESEKVGCERGGKRVRSVKEGRERGRDERVMGVREERERGVRQERESEGRERRA